MRGTLRSWRSIAPFGRTYRRRDRDPPHSDARALDRWPAADREWCRPARHLPATQSRMLVGPTRLRTDHDKVVAKRDKPSMPGREGPSRPDWLADLRPVRPPDCQDVARSPAYPR